ncbi:MAG: hypothetical protein OEY96_05405 [Gammaproteobacteria bacterium]|nr:hypothetical protein [Gammaproteobacteria bacterium]
MECESKNCGKHNKHNRLSVVVFGRPVVCKECRDLLELSSFWHGLVFLLLGIVIFATIWAANIIGISSWIISCVSLLIILVVFWLFAPLVRITEDKIKLRNQRQLILTTVFIVFAVLIIYFAQRA